MSQKLLEKGYDNSQKTHFIMEGLVMYIPPKAVDETLSFIVKNSGKGSAIIFDYYLQSLLMGRASQRLRKISGVCGRAGRAVAFGIEEAIVETFLVQRGFSRIRNVTSEDYKKHISRESMKAGR